MVGDPRRSSYRMSDIAEEFSEEGILKSDRLAYRSPFGSVPKYQCEVISEISRRIRLVVSEDHSCRSGIQIEDHVGRPSRGAAWRGIQMMIGHGPVTDGPG